MNISLYTGPMTAGDIQHHLAKTIGTELSHETIANITDAVLKSVTTWQERPLEEFYPVIYQVRSGLRSVTKAGRAPRLLIFGVGVDMEGIKHVLGIWAPRQRRVLVLGFRVLPTSQPGYSRRADCVVRCWWACLRLPWPPGPTR